MALHAPTVHQPAAIHVPGWLQAVGLAAIVLVILAVLSPLFPTSTPVMTDELYQQFRAEERNPGFSDLAIQNAWLDYRAGEQSMR